MIQYLSAKYIKLYLVELTETMIFYRNEKHHLPITLISSSYRL